MVTQAGPAFLVVRAAFTRSNSNRTFKAINMKRELLLSVVLTLAGSLLAADSNPKEEITGTAKKLDEGGNYTWKTTVEFGNFTGVTDGKSDKDGTLWLSMVFGDNTTEAVRKAGKWAVKTPDHEWQTLAELEAAAGTDPGPQQFLVRRLQNFKTPAAEVAELPDKIKEVKKEADIYSGNLTDDGAKELLSFGRRRGNAPEPKNAKGSAKLWIKSGALSKYELKLQGTMNFNGEDRDVDRTTTTEFKDIGATKIDVSEAAKKKLS
jgi:hypothetical protein